jgi:hypothetical protein
MTGTSAVVVQCPAVKSCCLYWLCFMFGFEYQVDLIKDRYLELLLFVAHLQAWSL